MAAPSRNTRAGTAIALPAMIVGIPMLALKHRYAARNVVIAELALFHAFSASQIAALNSNDVDLTRRVVRRRGDSHWTPLVTHDMAAWEAIVRSASASHDVPLCRTRSGMRVSRVDVWRVLHRLGIEAQLPVRLHTRRSRKWIGNALGRRNEISADSLKQVMGVRDPRAIAKYLPTKNMADMPDHVVDRSAGPEV